MTGLTDPDLINQAIQNALAVPEGERLFFRPPLSGGGGLSSAQRAEAYRLVKAPKCPTKERVKKNLFENFKYWEAYHEGRRQRMLKTGEIEPIRTSDHEPSPVVTPQGAKGGAVIVEQRTWADEYRIRTQVESTTKDLPPDNSGPRWSDSISERGLRALTDSGAYMAAVHGGFTTFVTMTFDDDARARLENDETTVQRELSRCFDAWGKAYKRGMKRLGIPPGEGDFQYLWVVEVPDNDRGEPNPHAHVLMRWAVPFEHFQDWAGRLESIWGQGFAHLEKINDPAAAGSYIAKAIGYLCKAQGKEDQGLVRGNRYGIATSARAPGWQVLTKMQLDCMSQLIADVYDHLSVKYGPDFRQRAALNRELHAKKSEIREYKKKCEIKRAPGWLARQQEKIEKRLNAVREKLDAIPIRTNRYQMICKGGEAFVDFMSWAKNPDFKPEIAPHLPEKPAGIAYRPGAYPKADDRLYFVKLRARFQEMKRRRQAITDEIGAALVERYDQMRADSMNMESWAVYAWGDQ